MHSFYFQTQVEEINEIFAYRQSVDISGFFMDVQKFCNYL